MMQDGLYDVEFFDRVIEVFPEDYLRSAIVVEIGTRFGAWVKQLQTRCENIPPNILPRVYCIDPWPRRAARGLSDTFPTWYRNLRPHVFRNVFPVRGTSQEWVRVWPEDLRPDVVYVDGSHRYEQVLDDSRMWWKILRPGGRMFWHDAQEAEVATALREFVHTDVSGTDIADLREERWGTKRYIVTRWLTKPEDAADEQTSTL